MVKILPAMQETWVLSWVEKVHWRRKQQPTPEFLPEDSHGQRSLAGYSPWSPKESDKTEQLGTHTHTHTQSTTLVLYPYIAKSQSMLASITVLPVNIFFSWATLSAYTWYGTVTGFMGMFLRQRRNNIAPGELTKRFSRVQKFLEEDLVMLLNQNATSTGHGFFCIQEDKYSHH